MTVLRGVLRDLLLHTVFGRSTTHRSGSVTINGHSGRRASEQHFTVVAAVARETARPSTAHSRPAAPNIDTVRLSNVKQVFNDAAQLVERSSATQLAQAFRLWPNRAAFNTYRDQAALGAWATNVIQGNPPLSTAMIVGTLSSAVAAARHSAQSGPLSSSMYVLLRNATGSDIVWTLENASLRRQIRDDMSQIEGVRKKKQSKRSSATATSLQVAASPI